jgi:hypothetical protein
MRTDIHKPSSIVPEDYAFVAFNYIKIQGLGDCYALKAQREIKAAPQGPSSGVGARCANQPNSIPFVEAFLKWKGTK